jgi:hypothetical protein
VTASGLKDIAPAEKALPPAPMVSGTLEDVLRILHQSYGFAHE